MPAATFNLTGQHIIEQGVPYTLLVRYPGSWVGVVAKSQIRKTYESLEVLAEFALWSVMYDPAIDKTLVSLLLTATQTRLLPVPLPSEHWVYDVAIEIAGEPLRLSQGKVHVSPGATRYA
jgi:hypothetical protein